MIIDADGRALGRVATRAASILAGKNRPDYTPHEDTGDFVVIINAAKVKLTGKKLVDKIYYRHTTYPGGIRTTSAGKILESKKPQHRRWWKSRCAACSRRIAWGGGCSPS